MQSQDNNDYYCEMLDSAAASIEAFPHLLEPASTLIVDTLLNDGKILVCGGGHALSIASHFSTCLMNQHDFERPSLPALNLSADGCTSSAIAKNSNYNDIYSQQIRAMANERDILVALSIDGNCGTIIQAVQAAHSKGMSVVTIVGYDGGNLSSIRQGNDVEVLIPANSMARVSEAQFMATNTLCHLVETKLFGTMHM